MHSSLSATAADAIKFVTQEKSWSPADYHCHLLLDHHLHHVIMLSQLSPSVPISLWHWRRVDHMLIIFNPSSSLSSSYSLSLSSSQFAPFCQDVTIIILVVVKTDIVLTQDTFFWQCWHCWNCWHNYHSLSILYLTLYSAKCQFKKLFLHLERKKKKSFQSVISKDAIRGVSEK